MIEPHPQTVGAPATRVRVKICGITRREDALAAAAAGADAIGLVFWPRSRRFVTPDVAAGIVAVLPPLVSAVGVFVDPDDRTLDEVLSSVPLDVLQFHGDETPHRCRAVGRRYVKAVRVRDGSEIEPAARIHAQASALLLDTYRAGSPGGTGETFDWSMVPHGVGLPLIVAGGLRPDNVGAAVAALRPHAVDVSGGVESAPGVKDVGKITEFMREVQRATTRELAV
ncbi:MAG: phosphoribosylanthranilate isomerase [Ectothiorhodospiraceae bacterium]|nr:phosphoribosylanthranilate isomerase [Chromatiales bacterium]MCP5156833.1 phosphoribosylanthranilate isomerase [Ectothiorhodospiraceae bacterium]